MEHLAVVTGASSGIGFELAKYAAHKNYDLVIAADEAEIEKAASASAASSTPIRCAAFTSNGTGRAVPACEWRLGLPCSSHIASLRKEGMGATEIAKAVGCRRGNVYKVLKAAGLN